MRSLQERAELSFQDQREWGLEIVRLYLVAKMSGSLRALLSKEEGDSVFSETANRALHLWDRFHVRMAKPATLTGE